MTNSGEMAEEETVPLSRCYETQTTYGAAGSSSTSSALPGGGGVDAEKEVVHIDFSAIHPPARMGGRRTTSTSSGVSIVLHDLSTKIRERGQKRCGVSDQEGDATMHQQIFNLTKNVVGSTMLAIPGAIANYGDTASALIPAFIAILVLAVINGYYFSIIGRVCAYTGATSYRQAWDRSMNLVYCSGDEFHEEEGEGRNKIAGGDHHHDDNPPEGVLLSSLSPPSPRPTVSTGWIIAWTNTLKAGFGNLAGSMILADSFHELSQGLGWTLSRTQVLLLITVGILWPLCMLKNLKRLAPFSVLGIIAVLWTVIAISWRYYDGTYAVEEGGRGGQYLGDVPPEYHPYFGSSSSTGVYQHPGGFLLLIGTLATAYVAHYNAPRFYVELRQHTLPRFNTVVTISYTLGAIIYIMVAYVGFLTFGGHCSSFILENYSTRDALAVSCRGAVDVSIGLSYPLVFVGLRDGVLDIIQLPPDKQTIRMMNGISTLLLVVITLMACRLTSLGLVLSFGGATFATAIIYVFPTLMFRACVNDMIVRRSFDRAAAGDTTGTTGRFGPGIELRLRKEVVLCLVLMVVGIILGCLGAVIALGLM